MQTDRDKVEVAFDAVKWDKIHAHMTLVDWKWVNGEYDGKKFSYGLPTIKRLKSTVRSLIEGVLQSDLDNTMHSTGGFSITKFTFDSGTEFNIQFDIS